MDQFVVSSPPNTPRWQFSLRTLLIGTTAVAGLVAFTANFP
jgi:hypothetical protein